MNWIDAIYQWLITATTKAETIFRAGYVWGIVATLVLFILIKIAHYFLFGRVKKVQEVCIPQEGGAIYISAGAIVDMVNIVAGEFDYVDVAKASLWESKSGITMKVKVKYDIKGKQFPNLCMDLKKAVQENLQGRLGVDCIRHIEIRSVKTSGTLNTKF